MIQPELEVAHQPGCRVEYVRIASLVNESGAAGAGHVIHVRLTSGSSPGGAGLRESKGPVGLVGSGSTGAARQAGRVVSLAPVTQEAMQPELRRIPWLVRITDYLGSKRHQQDL